MFQGKFETAGSITGEVEFSPLVQRHTSKPCTFKAMRAVVTWIGRPRRDYAVVEAADIRRKAASPTR